MKNILLLIVCALSFNFLLAQAPFGSKQSISTTTGNFPKFIESSNLDNDTFIDIVIGTNLGGTIEWYKNNGNQTFTLQALISSTLTNVNGLTIADLDNDQDNDIIATSESMNKIVWFENDGNGNFGAEQLIDNGLQRAGTVKAGDIDGDNNIDLAVVAYESNIVVWYSNDGYGNFGTAQTISNISNSGPRDLDLADYDLDGDLDIVVGYGRIYSVKLFNNNLTQQGSPTFTVESNNVVSGNYYINDVSFGDVDNDGDLEILKVDLLTNTAYYDKQSDGTFTETVFTTSDVYPATAMVSDLDDNSVNDVTIGYSSTNPTDKMTWYLDSNPTNENIIDNSQNDIFSFTINDFDNDGDLDMASISSNENHLNWFENTTYTFTLSNTEFNTQDISIYPNPTSDKINIKLNSSENHSVYIYNILGKKVMDQNLNGTNSSIDVSNLSNGIYLLSFKNTNSTFKFVKQ
ncbi:T9SS type A sorting domain-containing protein [Formosa maritima]|uniref:T9SS type A sorting domain-containing protein n=1 Tax=Formosa maritima TaxID=2592046 RepID=A0A5D0GJH1_9FLAO|nr:T9SS type A sorting domain-containing protein [Formosa maritima]TYA59148.1 T9SS type A sorting domain-containing protein [Formosa maritima]